MVTSSLVNIEDFKKNKLCLPRAGSYVIETESKLKRYCKTPVIAMGTVVYFVRGEKHLEDMTR